MSASRQSRDDFDGLPTHDDRGRPFGHGLASAAARLQLAARAEIDRALAARHEPGVRFPVGRATQLAHGYNLLAPGGPFVKDGQRVEDRSELLYVTSDIDGAIGKLRTALHGLPESAAQHARCALAFAAGAQAIREAATRPRGRRGLAQ